MEEEEQLTLEEVKDFFSYHPFYVTEDVYLNRLDTTVTLEAESYVEDSEVDDFLDYLGLDYTKYTDIDDFEIDVDSTFELCSEFEEVHGLYISNVKVEGDY